MFRVGVRTASTILLCCTLAPAQEKPIQREDSAKVSAGISREQLAQEDKLNTILSAADHALKAGKTDDALREYGTALDMVHKQPLLAEQEQRVLRRVGNAYLHANLSADAVAVFLRLLETEAKDCESQTTAVSSCADAQQSLAIAKIGADDINGGLVNLQEAEANYARAQKFSNSHEFTMVQIMEQGRTKVLIAVALFRLGKTADAVSSAEGAISQLIRVKEDSSITVGIRDSATNSIEEARTLLSRFKSAQ